MILVCPHCGSENDVPDAPGARTEYKCGACGSRLPDPPSPEEQQADSGRSARQTNIIRAILALFLVAVTVVVIVLAVSTAPVPLSERSSYLGIEFPIVVNVDEVVAFSENPANWPHALTGVWGNTTATEGFASREGYLVLVAEDERVIGLSTTSNAVWVGEYVDGIFEGKYASSSAEGTFRMEVQAGGGALYGEWSSGGREGDYEAYRLEQVDASWLEDHVRERFGENVEIVGD
jgi:DNA-directed RNA polymerase subunit RPC12/RpoP